MAHAFAFTRGVRARPRRSVSGRVRRALAFAVGLAAAALPASADAASGGLLPVPAVTIYPGDRVTPDMITRKHFYFDPTRPLPVIDHEAPILGKVARRTLAAGRPIPLNAFGEPDLVLRGRPVAARFERGGLRLQTTVLPLQNGALGDLVRARNIDTGRVITGTVTGEGILMVGGVPAADDR